MSGPSESAGFSVDDALMLDRCRIALLRAGLIEDIKDASEDDDASVESNEPMDPMALLRFIATGTVPEKEYVNETNANFGDLLGAFSLEYPMRHPLNAQTRDKLQARAAAQRTRLNENRNDLEKDRINIYKS